eukprot:1048299-Pelagomonas_calceolata.AAC.1
MGMEFASMFNGTLMVKSQLFKLVKGMLGLTGPTNTQKDDLVPSQYLISMYMPLVHTLMGLSNAGGRLVSFLANLSPQQPISQILGL